MTLVYRCLHAINAPILIPAQLWPVANQCFASDELIGLQLWLMGQAIEQYGRGKTKVFKNCTISSASNLENEPTSNLDIQFLTSITFRDGVSLVRSTSEDDCLHRLSDENQEYFPQ